jgi:hypothetical protein
MLSQDIFISVLIKVLYSGIWAPDGGQIVSFMRQSQLPGTHFC